MKKLFFVAAIACLSFASCRKEASDVGYGYIDLGITADILTKTVLNVDSSELESWTAVATKSGESSPAYSGTASGLASTPLLSGTYAVSVYTFADDAAAEAANERWGAARYAGEAEVTVSSGTTQNPTIECGAARNTRFTVIFDNSFKAMCTDENGGALDTYALTTKDARAIVFNKDTEGKYAYYAVSASVPYTFEYVYNGVPRKAEGILNMGDVAGTQRNIIIRSNNNGSISITISYDDSFIDGEDEILTIDALTGGQVEENK